MSNSILFSKIDLKLRECVSIANKFPNEHLKIRQLASWQHLWKYFGCRNVLQKCSVSTCLRLIEYFWINSDKFDEAWNKGTHKNNSACQKTLFENIFWFIFITDTQPCRGYSKGGKIWKPFKWTFQSFRHTFELKVAVRYSRS